MGLDAFTSWALKEVNMKLSDNMQIFLMGLFFFIVLSLDSDVHKICILSIAYVIICVIEKIYDGDDGDRKKRAEH